MLSNIDEVRAIQSSLRASFDTIPGKEVISFLEGICGWYDFKETNREAILIAHGKRQVLATIKTLLKLTPEQVIAMAKGE